MPDILYWLIEQAMKFLYKTTLNSFTVAEAMKGTKCQKLEIFAE